MLGKERPRVLERGQPPPLDDLAGVGERFERRGERRRDERIDVVGEIAGRDDEAQRLVAPAPTPPPRSAASTAIRSATECASGPMLSSDGASGSSPVRSTRSADGLKPAIPQNAAGTRIEPAVSVPIAHGTTPAATATADPDEEPPGARPSPCGFGGVPKCGLRPSPE